MMSTLDIEAPTGRAEADISVYEPAFFERSTGVSGQMASLCVVSLLFVEMLAPAPGSNVIRSSTRVGVAF